MLPTNLSDFLTYLGTPAFVALIVSVVLSHFTFYQQLTDQVKSLITLGLSIVLGLLSLFLVNNVSPDTLTKWQPVYFVIEVAISNWLAQIGGGAVQFAYDYWQETKLINLMKLAGIQINGQIAAALFPRHSAQFRALIAAATIDHGLPASTAYAPSRDLSGVDFPTIKR